MTEKLVRKIEDLVEAARKQGSVCNCAKCQKQMIYSGNKESILAQASECASCVVNSGAPS